MIRFAHHFDRNPDRSDVSGNRLGVVDLLKSRQSGTLSFVMLELEYFLVRP